MRQKRVFRRDGYVGFRCPVDFKERLEDVAKRKLRDVSSVALEFIAKGLAETERDSATAQLAQLQAK